MMKPARANSRLKRLLCLLLAAAMLLFCVPSAGSAANTGIILIAVNDTFPMSLSADTMPFYSGGTLYIPWTLFNVSTLGVTPSYNVLEGRLTLFNINSRIVFDLSAGTSTDSRNTGASWSTITKSSTVFLPAEYCASFFGIGISYLTSTGGYSVVRFTTGDEVYDDSYFMEKADTLIETRVAQFFTSGITDSSAQQSSAASSDTSSSSSSASSSAAASASGSTSAAVQTQTDTGSAEDSSEEETEEVETGETEEEAEAEETETAEVEPEEEAESAEDVYAVFYNAEGMEALAEELEADAMTGAFFLTAEELAEYPTLLSRLLGGGHRVGILLDTDADVAETLSAACDLADQQTCRRLLWVYARDGAEEAAELGYLVLTENSAGEEGLLLEVDSVDGIDILTRYQEAGSTIRLLRETTFP